MANEKRKGGQQGGRGDGGGKKRRAAGGGGYKPANSLSEIRGQGMWITCTRGKEARTVTEAYDMLNEAADKLYPETSTASTSKSKLEDLDIEDDEDDIEAQIAKELNDMQPKDKAERKKMRFMSVKTNCECLAWISCQPPCDPVNLAESIVKGLQNGGAVRSRHIQRLTPVSATGHADADSLKTIAYKVLQPHFAPENYTTDERDEDMPIKYRIEPFLRQHTASLSRDVVNEVIGEVVRDLTNSAFQYPVEDDTQADAAVAEEKEGDATVEPEQDAPTDAYTKAAAEEAETAQDSTGPNAASGNAERPIVKPKDPPPILPAVRRRAYVDLKNPTHVILVSALKGVCGISIVKGWQEGKKFNIQTLSERKPEEKPEERKEEVQIADNMAQGVRKTE